MISTCKHCEKTYWRFRGDHPPSGYCSIPHFEAGPAKKQKAEPPPAKPDAVLFQYRAHRISVHRDRSFLQDYECEECEKLQAIYADSMNYWLDHPLHYGGAEKKENTIL